MLKLKSNLLLTSITLCLKSQLLEKLPNKNWKKTEPNLKKLKPLLNIKVEDSKKTHKNLLQPLKVKPLKPLNVISIMLIMPEILLKEMEN